MTTESNTPGKTMEGLKAALAEALPASGYYAARAAAAAAGPQVKQMRHEVLVNGTSLQHGPGFLEGEDAEATIAAYGPGKRRKVEIVNKIVEYPACSCARSTPMEIGPCCAVCDRLTPEAAARFAPEEGS